MARIRTVKPEFWQDEELSKVSYLGRLLFIGILNMSDDYGICKANVKLLKAQIFPYDENLRIAEVSQCIDQLIKVRMLVPFTIEDEGYLYVRTFSVHQKIDKPSKNGHISAEKLKRVLNLAKAPANFDEYSESVPLLVGLGKERKGKERESISPTGDGGTDVPPESKSDPYKEVEKTKECIYEYIKKNKPKEIEPYKDLWNIFAEELKYPQISKITPTRKRKFALRIQEPTFDFGSILRKAKASKFLSEGNWFTFDWLIENENNYLKLLEGKYDTKQPPEETVRKGLSAQETHGQHILNSV